MMVLKMMNLAKKSGRFSLTVASAVTVSGAAWGSVTYDGVTYPTSKSEAAAMGYVTINTVGGYGESPFGMTAQANSGAYFWSDNSAPSSSKNYFFDSNPRSVKGSGNVYKCSFGGKVAVISGFVQWKTSLPYYMDFPNDGAVVLPDAKLNSTDNNMKEMKITGTLTVLSTASNPFLLLPTREPGNEVLANGFDLSCTLKGPSTAAILCRPSATGAARGWLRVIGETSAYLGAVNVRNNDLFVGAYGLANGTIALSETAGLRLCASDGGTVSVSTLSVDGQSEVVLNPTNCLSVTTAVSLADGATIRLDLGSYAGGATRRAVMTAPEGSGLARHLKDWSQTHTELGVWRSGSLQVETVGGVETVYLNLAGADMIVTQTNGDGDASVENGSSAFTNATSWTDGRTVHGGADYLVRNGFTLRTLEEGRGKPADYQMTYPEFLGASLTMGPNTTLAIRQTRIGFDMLRLCPLSTIHFGNTHVKYVTGNIALPGSDADDPAWLVAYYYSANGIHQVNASISGTGSLVLKGLAGSGDPRGHVMLGGINTNWTGRMTVTIGTITTSGRETPTWRNTAYLHITNALALGAARTAFTYNALQLEQCGALCVENGFAVTLDTANRGVFVKDWGQMIVGTDSSLAIKNDVTYCGELRKTGTGLLALGGTARFGVGGAYSPSANSNVLNVVEGAFKPLSAYCLDGVAATFGTGARLVYDLLTEDTTLRTKGVVLENPASALTFSDAIVPVTIDCGGVALGDAEYTLGLATAGEATVRTLATKLNVAKPAKGYSVKMAVAPTDGGLWTLSAMVYQSGFKVIFR